MRTVLIPLMLVMLVDLGLPAATLTVGGRAVSGEFVAGDVAEVTHTLSVEASAPILILAGVMGVLEGDEPDLRATLRVRHPDGRIQEATSGAREPARMVLPPDGAASFEVTFSVDSMEGPSLPHFIGASPCRLIPLAPGDRHRGDLQQEEARLRGLGGEWTLYSVDFEAGEPVALEVETIEQQILLGAMLPDGRWESMDSYGRGRRRMTLESSQAGQAIVTVRPATNRFIRPAYTVSAQPLDVPTLRVGEAHGGRCSDIVTLALPVTDEEAFALEVDAEFPVALHVSGAARLSQGPAAYPGHPGMAQVLLCEATGSGRAFITLQAMDGVGGEFALAPRAVESQSLGLGLTETFTLGEATPVFDLPIPEGHPTLVEVLADSPDWRMAVEGLRGGPGQALGAQSEGQEGTAQTLFESGRPRSFSRTAPLPPTRLLVGRPTAAPREGTLRVLITGLGDLEETSAGASETLSVESGVGAVARRVTSRVGDRLQITARSASFDPVVTVVTEPNQHRQEAASPGGGEVALEVTVPRAGAVPLSVRPREPGAEDSVELEVVSLGRAPAPAFTLRDPDGGEVSSTQFDGDVRIIDFWATWCGPCVRGIPHLMEIGQEYADRGVSVIGVSVDHEGLGVVRAFIEEHGVDYAVAMDDNATSAAFAELIGQSRIESIPTAFIVDREGGVAEIVRGYRPKEHFVETIETLLAED